MRSAMRKLRLESRGVCAAESSAADEVRGRTAAEDFAAEGAETAPE